LRSDPPNVLIVDTSKPIRKSLGTFLASSGYSIVEAARGEEALRLIRTGVVDAVFLDVSLPGMGGVEVCRIMRRLAPRLSIIMLTAPDNEDGIVAALGAGANDYIIRPFRFGELAARLRVAMQGNNIRDAHNETILIGGFLLDSARHQAVKNGRTIHLTPREFELVRYLMSVAGKPVSHIEILKSVWGRERAPFETLRTMVKKIRKKIEDDPAKPEYLLTEPSIGYRFKQEPPECR
jgi:two-component system, OmpR family, KDP operon response regulator KdpE